MKYSDIDKLIEYKESIKKLKDLRYYFSGSRPERPEIRFNNEKLYIGHLDDITQNKISMVIINICDERIKNFKELIENT